MNDLPEVPTTKAAARAAVRQMVSAIGLGYHPDTPGADYDPPFSKVMARRIDAVREAIFRLIGGQAYEVGLAAQNKLFKERRPLRVR